MTSSFVATTRLGLVLGCSLCVWLACGADTQKPSPPRGAVVILLDTLRADHLSSYGYERNTTPAIDALAGRGVLFERVVAPAPWTLPSVGALLAARHPSVAFGPNFKLAVSLVERIRDAGFATAAVTEGGYVSEYFGMDRGFASYVEERGAVGAEVDPDRVPKEDTSSASIARVFAKANDWLRGHSEEPFFLLVHSYQAHTPYADATFAQDMEPGRIGAEFQIAFLGDLRSGRIRLTPDELAYGTALYDGDIHLADQHVGELLRTLDELGIADDTVVAVVSDHGEELGEGFEHAIFDHGHSLRDDQLLVPFVLFDPTRDFPVDRVETQVRLIDVIPTVVDLLGVEPDVAAAGRSLLPVLEGSETLDRVAFSSLNNRGPLRASVRTGRYKLIRVVGPPMDPAQNFPPGVQVPEVQLYDLQNDPNETTNLAAGSPGLAAELTETLGHWMEELRVEELVALPSVEDEKLRERLHSLGYAE